LLDDVVAMGEEEVEKLDVCLKRHLAWLRRQVTTVPEAAARYAGGGVSRYA
jgi:hypothetical protein